MSVGIIGAGSWGTALAVALSAKKNFPIALWVRSDATYEAIVLKRCNEVYLPEVRIPSSVLPTMSLKEAVKGKEMIILAVPSAFTRGIIREIRPHLDPGTFVVSTSKSLEPETHLRLSVVLEDELPTYSKKGTAIITGPGHAEELANFVPMVLNISSTHTPVVKAVQESLVTEDFRLKHEPDMIGMELGGAVSSVAALASGVIEGVDLGDSLRGNVLAALYRETVSLGRSMGARAATFAGRSCLGDIFANCCSPYSRHRFLGKELGKGRTLADIRSGRKTIFEGVSTLRSLFALFRQAKLESPVTDILFHILFEGESPEKIFNIIAS
ncbi:MAG: NAD(P)H-dependent glycerol-3-phosphate dehydrogenase [Firmicutes bacterium]|jgi:glycerol-3-phosphate dehydrogenase (NAD(P)+)|nr:NAD(P)H-dependent glycerol-3-phosphate dehydrogenase [Bacillota bacterium]